MWLVVGFLAALSLQSMSLQISMTVLITWLHIASLVLIAGIDQSLDKVFLLACLPVRNDSNAAVYVLQKVYQPLTDACTISCSDLLLEPEFGVIAVEVLHPFILLHKVQTSRELYPLFLEPLHLNLEQRRKRLVLVGCFLNPISEGHYDFS